MRPSRAILGAAIALGAIFVSACGSDSGALGSAGGGDGGTTGPAGAEQICVDKINEYRATLGLPPYARWTDQESCSSGEAKSDSMSGTAHGAFGTCGEFAQNECPGWPGPPETMIPKCLELMWGEGPGGGHYENMKGSRGYTKAACGFFVKPDGSVWSVQNFK